MRALSKLIFSICYHSYFMIFFFGIRNRSQQFFFFPALPFSVVHIPDSDAHSQSCAYKTQPGQISGRGDYKAADRGRAARSALNLIFSEKSEKQRKVSKGKTGTARLAWPSVIVCPISLVSHSFVSNRHEPLQ